MICADFPYQLNPYFIGEAQALLEAFPDILDVLKAHHGFPGLHGQDEVHFRELTADETELFNVWTQCAHKFLVRHKAFVEKTDGSSVDNPSGQHRSNAMLNRLEALTYAVGSLERAYRVSQGLPTFDIGPPPVKFFDEGPPLGIFFIGESQYYGAGSGTAKRQESEGSGDTLTSSNCYESAEEGSDSEDQEFIDIDESVEEEEESIVETPAAAVPTVLATRKKTAPVKVTASAPSMLRPIAKVSATASAPVPGSSKKAAAKRTATVVAVQDDSDDESLQLRFTSKRQASGKGQTPAKSQTPVKKSTPAKASGSAAPSGLRNPDFSAKRRARSGPRASGEEESPSKRPRRT